MCTATGQEIEVNGCTQNHTFLACNVSNSFVFAVELESRTKEALEKLVHIYDSAIRPMEQLYNFNDLNKHVVTGTLPKTV